jgi:hypothetical protein
MYPKRLTKRKQARLIRDARACLDGFGVDWSLYGEPHIEGLPGNPTRVTNVRGLGETQYHATTETDDGIVLAIVWTRKDNPDVQIELGQVWWNDDTGEILQCGSNYGRLVM